MRCLAIVAALCAVTVAAGCTRSATTGAPSSVVAPSTPSKAAPTTTAPNAATGGASPTAPAHARPADWPTYHGFPDRRGVSTTMPDVTGSLRVQTKIGLDGNVYASPVVADGVVVAATEQDTVYGFDTKFHQLWKRNLGMPSPGQERPCGNIDPLGITSTPVIANGTVYVVAELGGSIRHEMVALDLKTGAIEWRRGIDLSGADPTVMQQRGALALAGGKVWAPFGALYGDCGGYKGRVVGLPLDGRGPITKFDPSTGTRGGIWNPAGPTVDAQGHLLVVSANGSSYPGDAYDHTNSVDEIDTSGRLLDSFAPTDWAQNNKDDVGLGSQGVALVGSQWAVLGGKSGPVYVLRQGQLGGVGGQVDVQNICLSFGGGAVDGDVVYLPCADGVRAVRVDTSGQLHVLWHAFAAITGSPVVGGGRVWALDQQAGVLHALDPRTGQSSEQIDVGTTSRFATPALYGSEVIVPTLAGITVVTYG
jgi:outer membrane protein assembly factor BamB